MRWPFQSKFRLGALLRQGEDKCEPQTVENFPASRPSGGRKFIQPTETHQQDSSARHDGRNELCCQPFEKRLQMQRRRCNWNDNENRVLLTERASARRKLYDYLWGRFTAFVAFIGVKQPQLLVFGAYSSTGENNLCLFLFFWTTSHILGWGSGRKRLGMSSRAEATRSAKKQVTVAGVNGTSG